MSYQHETRMSVSTGLLVLRLVLGVVFLMHAWQKFTQWGLAGTTATFAQMGVPMPQVAAPVAAWLELVGGIALLLGLLSRWAGLLLALEMVGAIVFAHAQGGFFAANGGYELVLCLAAMGLTVFFAGPGRLALSGAFESRRGWNVLA